MQNKNCLLVGFGKMGKLYYKILKDLKFKKIYVISKPLEKKYEKNSFFLDDIKKFKKKKIKIDLAVVATTADVHDFYVKELAYLNIKFIMVEKPISTSIKSAQEMIELCQKKRCTLSVNHSFRFNKAISKIKKINDSKELGKLISINVIGGNMGLSMNGVHFFEIFNYLTKNPISVVSAEIDKKILINPRGKKFKDNSGLIIGKNKKRQFIFINLLEQQGHGKTISFVFRNGIIYLDFLIRKMIISKRIKKNFRLDTRFYSTKTNAKIYKFKENIYESTKKSIKSLLIRKNHISAKEGLDSIKAVAAAIESGQKGGSQIFLKSLNKMKKFSWA